MRFHTATLSLFAALITGAAVTAPAAAQAPGTLSPRVANDRAVAAIRTRVASTDARIVTAQRGGHVTRARATALHRQIALVQANMARLSQQQGFVSAAEQRTAERTLAAIDLELDRAGVARGYGRDMLPAAPARTHPVGHDALPSAEVAAFQRTDARLHYRNARIERDARGCAVYRGTAANGRIRDEPLLTPDRKPICLRR